MSDSLIRAFDGLASRRVLLFGGKGGVGKTTLAAAAALHFSATRQTILFTSDPASNLEDLFRDAPDVPPRLEREALDADVLYRRFLDEHLASFLEIGDRGLYLDREELRRLLELSLPGADELMAWMRIGELAELHPDAMLVVDTAPTGHTLRMLGSAEHFAQLAVALDAMQEKHRAMVFQFTRRDVRDAMDAFIDEFRERAERRSAFLRDPQHCAFVPVTLAEPLVVEQTLRLIDEVGLDVPLVVVNRARSDEVETVREFAPRPVVIAQRACAPLDSLARIAAWSRGEDSIFRQPAVINRRSAQALSLRRMTFLAGKGGVGKTSCSASIALQLALRHPDRRYVVLSVDPAHSLRDLFARIEPPVNLQVEMIDTRAKWTRFRQTLGAQITDAFDALTPRGMSISHDADAMRSLVEIAPPGADELFAINRLAELARDESVHGVIVDTAPTGHFLRLLALPQTAGEWVREFMRLLLRYKDLIPAGSLGEELVHASRALKELEATLHSQQAGVVVVARPERVVLAETRRLIDSLRTRQIGVLAVIANAVTPQSDDACEQSIRAYELEALTDWPEAILIERRSTPPSAQDDLLSLVPMASET